MKEILFCVILLINIYSLYKIPTKFNVVIILITTLLLTSYCLNSYKPFTESPNFNLQEHFLNGYVPPADAGKDDVHITSVPSDTDQTAPDYTGIIGMNSDIFFYDKTFREPLFQDPKYRKLVQNLSYYVSTFDSHKVNLDKGYLESHIYPNKYTKNFSFKDQLLTNNETKFHQNNGIKIVKKLDGPSARNLLDGDFEEFTFFWYCKFDFQEKWFYYSDKSDSSNIIENQQIFRPCYKYKNESYQEGKLDNVCLGGEDRIKSAKQNNKHVYSFFAFDHENIVTKKGNYKLLDIRFTFIPGDYNPTIDLRFADNMPAGGHLTYTYKPTDFFKRKIMSDGQFHLFTFVKWGGKVYFFMDDEPLIDCSIDGSCFVKKNFALYQNDPAIKIRDTPIRLNDNVVTKNDNGDIIDNGLQLNLNAFGVYSKKTFDSENTPQSFVTELTSYFRHVKDYMLSYKKFGLNDETMSLKEQLADAQSKLKDLEHQRCPFSNESICQSMECQYISNWNNIGHLANTPACFVKVMEYCNDPANVNKEQYCSFLNSKNIGLLARNLMKDNDFREGLGTDNLTNIGEAGCRYEGERLRVKRIAIDPSVRATSQDPFNDTIRIANDNVISSNKILDDDFEEPDDVDKKQADALLKESSGSDDSGSGGLLLL